MKTTDQKPPFWARRLLRRLERYEAANVSSGDFDETFHRISEAEGVRAARRWYRAEVLGSVPAYFRQSLIWRLGMISILFKTALRLLRRERLFAGINILGLAVGLTASLLIFLWAQYELSYDRHHAHADTLFRVLTVKDADAGVVVPVSAPALAPLLASDYAEVSAACRLRLTSGVLQKPGNSASAQSLNLVYADAGFFDCFTHPVVQGTIGTDWDRRESVILTRGAARRFFGDAPAVGEVLILQGQSLRVEAVIADAPGPSHLIFDAVVPLSVLARQNHRFDPNTWRSLSLWTYVRLDKPASAPAFEERIRRVMSNHVDGCDYELRLQRLRDIHLHALEGPDPIQTVRLYMGLAFFILLVAAINFVNLATARSSRRGLEVGLRKTLGARRSELMLQFQGEALFQTFIAYGLALVLAGALLPRFNALTGNPIPLAMSVSGGRWIIIAALPWVLGWLAGFYPAWVLAAYRPRQIMHRGGGHRSGHRFRQGLVVLQFVLSLILFIGALGVARQLHYLQNRPLGFDERGLVFTEMQAMDEADFEALRGDLLARPAIQGVTRTNMPLLDLGFETDGITWQGQRPEQKVNVQIRTADAHYLETLGMSLAQGRFFEENRRTDTGQSCVLNEAAVRAMGLENPIGQWFSLGDAPLTIIGVVKDFHHHSMHTAIEPLVLVNWPQVSQTLFVRLRAGQETEALAHLQSLWPRIQPDRPFQVRYFTEALSALYRNERHMGTLVWWLGGLAVLVACLGLLGLTAYTVEEARREMGIRKVLGATARGIVAQITGKYIRWVLLAVTLAWPLSYTLLDRWLSGFAYRARLSWDLFILGGVVILVLAGVTVAGLTLKAALAPPVQALRQE